MMRSMFSGVSGLKNMQMAMDVIGNNMANVNTPGFKRSRVVFQDTLYQAMRGGAAPTDSTGGTNPMGVGMGMAVSAVDQVHTGATAQSSSRLTDMAIDGNGYFIVKTNGETSYTRSGAFSFDKLGNLVTSDGGIVQGWLADADGNIDASVSKVTGVNIAAYNLMAPKATSTMGVTGNLDSETAANSVDAGFDMAAGIPADDTSETVTKEFYDSLGNKGILYFRFFKTTDTSATPTTSWNCDVSMDPEFSGDANSDGKMDGTVEVVTPGASPTTNPDVIRYTNINFDSKGKLVTTPTADNASSMSFTISRAALGADDVTIKVDLNSLLQYNTDSTVQIESQNGLPTGSLQSLSVGSDGVISGQYDNGQLKSLARVALANFRNPSGLQQVGGNQFVTSTNSGDAMVGAPSAGGMGAILPSSLEMSNVDLSEELTNMIIVERGFTANSRIITTSDEMLQELANLKR
ncbi:MAG: flagellar hook protein FlgE [Syntrophomonadaceae bacterium]